jgi:hypothetical protein
VKLGLALSVVTLVTTLGCGPNEHVVTLRTQAGAIGARLRAIRAREHGAACPGWFACEEVAATRCEQVAVGSRPIHMVFQEGYAGWNCTVAAGAEP